MARRSGLLHPGQSTSVAAFGDWNSAVVEKCEALLPRAQLRRFRSRNKTVMTHPRVVIQQSFLRASCTCGTLGRIVAIGDHVIFVHAFTNKLCCSITDLHKMTANVGGVQEKFEQLRMQQVGEAAK